MLCGIAVSRLSLFVATAANTLAISTTRYTAPIPKSMKVIDTRQELNNMAGEYPLGYLDERNGGYYLVNFDHSTLAVTSDSLCEELDAVSEEAERYLEFTQRVVMSEQSCCALK
ncbi:hypothetical protein N7508_000172 [Penicillium antarcticum]|uniref:uncharacterized protein n=1 Tax=Penicillium antarcticum TaxID=416450 RepID=UPI002390C3A9|nr:uncharacterized protein N7508_000172 [Penicillium antarcticum]KAJ5319889.1 hypothetical protein N7508_000172 [Penicillium antarcticum]